MEHGKIPSPARIEAGQGRGQGNSAAGDGPHHADMFGPAAAALRGIGAENRQADR
jgi:hypothetical protein